MNIGIFVLLLIGFLLISCSSKVTYRKLNKPFYDDFKVGNLRAYKEYGEFAPETYKKFHRMAKDEFDLYINYRNKVLDSIKLLDEESWMIIQLSSHKYSGSYERTYIFKRNECIYYYLDAFSFENESVIYFQTTPIDLLKDEEIAKIYNHFKKKSLPEESQINLKPIGHPRITYRIRTYESKKLDFYKIDAKDYIIMKK